MPLVGLQRHFDALALQIGRAATEVDAVLGQRPGDQPRQVGGAVAQGEVVAAIDQVDEGIVEVHLQAHLWMLAHEAAADLVEEGRSEGRRRGKPQGAAQFVLQLVHFLSGQLQLHQGLARALQVDVPGLGQGHAPGGALEQAHAQLALQVPHGLGQGRGRLAQLLGGTTETAVLGRGDEHGERTELVHLSVPNRHKSCAKDSILPPGGLG
ncbi:hypothetical protein FQZ97_729910 [compost metagenome]